MQCREIPVLGMGNIPGLVNAGGNKLIKVKYLVLSPQHIV